MSEHHDQSGVQGDRPAIDQAAEKREAGRRLEAVGWGLFFIMLGVLWALPEEVLPEGKGIMAAAIGVGAILLGVNFARHLSEVEPRGGEIILGTLALIWGVAGFYGTELPLFPVLFVLIGLAIILSGRKHGRGCGCC
jgi:hypothetical protein